LLRLSAGNKKTEVHLTIYFCLFGADEEKNLLNFSSWIFFMNKALATYFQILQEFLFGADEEKNLLNFSS
jgi:hypothetical protein